MTPDVPPHAVPPHAVPPQAVSAHPGTVKSGTAKSPNAALTFLKRFWLPIILVILAIVFIVTNTEDATFNIGWIRITQPLWLLLTVTVLVGFVIGWFVGPRRGTSD